MSANVESMFSVRETPWHGLGTIVAEALTSEEALKLAGLDWTVRQEELVYNGTNTGYMLNVRDTDNSLLGIVRGRYVPVQNLPAFSFMDKLASDGVVTYETAGSLASGKRIWMLAKMDPKNILGDIVEPYMLLMNSHDGFGCLKVCMTPVRVVCQNTLNLALGRAKRTWAIRHSGNLDAKMAEARHTLGLATHYMDSLSANAEELYKIKISPADFNSLKDALFPITAEMSKRKEESQLLLQESLRNAWEVDDLGNHRGTGWGFMNAVSDLSTHKEPGRKTANARENGLMYVLEAPVLLDTAYKLMMSRV